MDQPPSKATYDIRQALSNESLANLMNMLVKRRLMAEEPDEHAIPRGYKLKPIYTSDCIPTSQRLICSDIPIYSVAYMRNVTPSERSDVKICRLPYGDAANVDGNQVRSTDKHNKTKQEKRQEAMGRLRINKELQDEHRIFMKNLKLGRINSGDENAIAAIVIQRYLRGFTVRRKATTKDESKQFYSRSFISDLIQSHVDPSSKPTSDIFSMLNLKLDKETGLHFEI